MRRNGWPTWAGIRTRAKRREGRLHEVLRPIFRHRLDNYRCCSERDFVAHPQARDLVVGELPFGRHAKVFVAVADGFDQGAVVEFAGED